ncbi:bifunctional copper resistance protein CopD/cytochrome c oxidase assembly protein [Actinomycetospora soli]|uniref:bifunctional copper resistance protein CopD/cytochrome c oxidase assembly protein n=1 Tax=Actinomycetospora soli TaxID=2893887 RepID=UPI001E5CF8B5|nr:cytochrome c oxidase assembly protein [Actinomycetospora soli]MCD2191058.1 bifunctional copper resistance protein CopD/cytochrome c oxidase assembly protein [Actinomycetospora soli]
MARPSTRDAAVPTDPADRRPSTASAVFSQALPGAAVAAVVALALTALSGAETYARLGLPDPGPVVTYGLPVVRALTESAAVVTVGALLLAAFLVPPRGLGWLAADGYRAVRVASWSAAAWAGGALVTGIFAIADAFARPLSAVLTTSTLTESLGGLPAARIWFLTAGVAVCCALVARLALSWHAAVGAFALAVLGVLPAAFGGHSGTGTAHDVAMNSLALHVVAAALWVGGLLAVLVHAVVGGADLPTALGRFSTTAFWCWVVLALSGTVNALLRVNPADLLVSTYGLLLLAKVAGLVVLGVFGAAHRTRTLPDVAAGSRSALVRLGGVEVLIMFATVGVAVALGRTPPPEMTTPLPSRVEALLGYSLDRPLDLVGLVMDARPDLLLGTAAVVAALGYLAGVRRLCARGAVWAGRRTASWLVGCAVLLLATSSGIGAYAPAQLSVHMIQQVLVAFVVAPAWVLGRPVALLRAVRPPGTDELPGPGEWLPALRRSRVGRWATAPVVATVVLVGTGWVLDAGGLFDALVPEHVGHLTMTVGALAAGCLFARVVANATLPVRARVGMVAVAVVGQVALAVTVATSSRVVGADHWRQLALPFVDRAVDQTAGGFVLGAAVVPLLALLVVARTRSDVQVSR